MRLRALRWLLIGASLWITAPSGAVMLDQFEFTDKAEEDRYKDLIAELRCLVCQNQSLLDSDAELAQDLRVETFRLMKEGRDDEQVKSYLVDRYGDFVLYRPPLKQSTYLLWFGPFVLLVVAAGFLLINIRKRNQSQLHEITPEERARLRQAMGKDTEGDSQA